MHNIMKFIVLAGLFATAGCFSWPVSFSQSSSPLQPGHYTVLANEVTGTSSQIEWLFFSFGKGGSAQRHALADALRQVPGATALTAMAVDEETFVIFPFILPSFTSTRVTGTPVKTTDND